jgi:hypothetical protein
VTCPPEVLDFLRWLKDNGALDILDKTREVYSGSKLKAAIAYKCGCSAGLLLKAGLISGVSAAQLGQFLCGPESGEQLFEFLRQLPPAATNNRPGGVESADLGPQADSQPEEFNNVFEQTHERSQGDPI